GQTELSGERLRAVADVERFLGLTDAPTTGGPGFIGPLGLDARRQPRAHGPPRESPGDAILEELGRGGKGPGPWYNATRPPRGHPQAAAGPLQPAPEPPPPLARLPRRLGRGHGPAAQPRGPAARLLRRPPRRPRRPGGDRRGDPSGAPGGSRRGRDGCAAV